MRRPGFEAGTARSALVLASFFAAACVTHTSPLPAGSDADFDADSDAGADSGPAVEPVLGATLAATLEDGSTSVGELVATYDHSQWWHDASPTLTYALYDAARYAPYPNDTSFALVDSTHVLGWAIAPAAGTPYVDSLRAQGFVLERPPLDGVSYVITGHEGYHLEEDGFGDFAWDFVILGPTGMTFATDGSTNEDYHVWDAPVYLPTGGDVLEAFDDAPDNTPGSYEDRAPNNLVGVHLGGSFYLYLLHFRQDSLAAEVVVGATLPAGTYLGRAGNAGVSLAPHLHVVLLWYDAAAEPPRSWSVPAELTNVFVSIDANGPAQLMDYAAPNGGTFVSATAF